mgnify:CR=1 FL=1
MALVNLARSEIRLIEILAGNIILRLYIYSMKALFDPQMKNYRAADYMTDNLSIANAQNYYYSGRMT